MGKVYNFIDVSEWQGKIDWKKVKAAGIDGAIIRFADGTYLDKKFDYNMKNAIAAGLHVGCYIFSRAKDKAGAEKEATRLYNAASKYKYDMPLYIDLEDNSLRNYADTVAAAFLNKMKALGATGGVYANLNWWNNYLTKTAKDYSESPFWIAQYYTKVTHKKPSLFGMWQYTSSGKVNGISGRVDRDRCYIAYWDKKIEQKKTETTKTTTVAALSIDELAKQVIEGKWGSGEDRKKNLEKAGYDYDKVQAKVNQILSDNILTREEVIARGNAWARKICADNRYHYNMWNQKITQSHLCPICSGLDYNKDSDHFGWNCIGFSIAVWHHGFGLPCKCNCYWITGPGGTGEKLLSAKTDAEALKLAKKYTGLNDIAIIRNKNGIPKKQWKAGDICLEFSGDTFQHAFYYPGGDTVIDSTRIYNDKSKWTPAVKAKQIAERSYKNYSAKVIVRWTGGEPAKKKYTGTLPSTKLVKTNAEVIADAIKFGKWIAGDNTFHYGYTDKHGSDDPKKWDPNAHHNGCYFCGTNVDHGGRSKKGIVDYQHTYCCNPLIGACWAHGGCVPKALELCKKGSSWNFEKGTGYDKSSLFTNIGKPKKSDLKAGDVLCSDSHVAMFIGGGKIVEAAGGDDNKKGSEKWNNSIHVATLTDKRYAGFKRVHRFNSSVNTTCCMFHGEVGKRVELLQKFLKWYGYDITVDSLFGDATLKAVKAFQKAAGITADGIVGPNTIAAMGKAVK